MPTDKNFKRLVRERMRKTGESYTTARAQLARRFRRETALPSAPDRAVAELKRKFDQLHDAVDQALASGLTWADIAQRLRVDAHTLKQWFDDDVIAD